MPGSYPDSVNPGLFLSTTPMFDVGDLNEETLKQLVIQLTQFTNNIAIILNQKESAIYDRTQFVCGQTYFPNPALTADTPQTPVYRQVYRQVFNFGALPNVGLKVLAHNIAPTAIFSFTRIYGTSSDPIGLTYIPIPQAFVNGDIIDLSVDMTNIIVHTNFNASNFSITYIVLEWLPY